MVDTPARIAMHNLLTKDTRPSKGKETISQNGDGFIPDSAA